MEGITPLLINIMLSRKTHTDIAAVRVITLYFSESLRRDLKQRKRILSACQNLLIAFKHEADLFTF
jgi:ADP-glucose pyrophosphorylase